MGGSGPSQRLHQGAQRGWPPRTPQVHSEGRPVSPRRGWGGAQASSPHSSSKQFKPRSQLRWGRQTRWAFQLAFHIWSLWNPGGDYQPTGEGPPTGSEQSHSCSPTCGSVDAGSPGDCTSMRKETRLHSAHVRSAGLEGSVMEVGTVRGDPEARGFPAFTEARLCVPRSTPASPSAAWL